LFARIRRPRLLFRRPGCVDDLLFAETGVSRKRALAVEYGRRGSFVDTMTEFAGQPDFVPGHMGPRGIENMRRIFKALLTVFARPVGVGMENVPPGGVIVSPNHLSRFDPPMVFIFLPKRKITVFNADTYRSSKFFTWIMNSTDV